MKKLPIFWSFRRCPYAMRARLAVKSAGIEVELREILLREKPALFLAASTTATVPVLELLDGQVIEESRDIMFWALQESGDPEGWLSGWQQDEAATTLFLDQLDGPFKTDLDRYKYAARFASDKTDAAELALNHRASGAAFLGMIEARLTEHPFLNGLTAGLADYAALPFVRQFRIADMTWFDAQDWPGVHHWLQTFLSSQRFADIMHKYSPWQPDQPPETF